MNWKLTLNKRLYFTENTDLDFADHPHWATKIGDTYVRCNGTHIQRSTDRITWTTTIADLVSVVRTINNGGEDRVYVGYIDDLGGGNFTLTVLYANEVDLLNDNWTSDAAAPGENGYAFMNSGSIMLDIFKCNSELWACVTSTGGGNTAVGFVKPDDNFDGPHESIWEDLSGTNKIAPGYVEGVFYYYLGGSVAPT